MVLLVLLLVASLCVGSSFGHCHLDYMDPCSKDDECAVKCIRSYSNCDKGRCGCHPGDVWDRTAIPAMCYTPSLLGGPCASDSHCPTQGVHCDEITGLCTCDGSNMVEITPRFCVHNSELSSTDLCNTTDAQYYFIITGTDTKGNGEFKGTLFQPCGCPEGREPDPQDARKCATNVHREVTAPVWGPLVEGDTCIKGGADTSRQCAQGMRCDTCPGETLNKFTCNTIITAVAEPQTANPDNGSPALVTATFSLILVAMTSFIMM